VQRPARLIEVKASLSFRENPVNFLPEWGLRPPRHKMDHPGDALPAANLLASTKKTKSGRTTTEMCKGERLISCSAPGRTSMRLDVRADADMICALHLPPQLACLTTGTTELDDQPVDGFMRRILYGASARRKIQDCIFNMLSAASCLAETNLHTLRGLTASGFCSSSSWRSCFF